jgi:hypothetical protein
LIIPKNKNKSNQKIITSHGKSSSTQLMYNKCNNKIPIISGSDRLSINKNVLKPINQNEKWRCKICKFTNEIDAE